MVIEELVEKRYLGKMRQPRQRRVSGASAASAHGKEELAETLFVRVSLLLSGSLFSIHGVGVRETGVGIENNDLLVRPENRGTATGAH